MGNGCMKDNENVYFRARKMAAQYNERLQSREGASEMLGISVSTLADYELGITKVVPVDKVVLMAEMYRCPELKNGYCKYECPIGKTMPIATEAKGLEASTLQVLNHLDTKKLEKLKSKLVEITVDGIVDDSEYDDFIMILEELNKLAKAISETRLLGEKIVNENKRR